MMMLVFSIAVMAMASTLHIDVHTEWLTDTSMPFKDMCKMEKLLSDVHMMASNWYQGLPAAWHVFFEIILYKFIFILFIYDI